MRGAIQVIHMDSLGNGFKGYIHIATLATLVYTQSSDI